MADPPPPPPSPHFEVVHSITFPEVDTLSIIPNTNFALLGCSSDHGNEVVKLDVRSGEVIDRRDVGDIESSVFSLVVSPCASFFFIVSGGRSINVPVFSVDTLGCEDSLSGNLGDVWCVAVSPDSTMAVIGGVEGVLKVWKKGERGRWGCTKTWQ